MQTFTRRAAAVVLTGALTGLAAIATAVVPITVGSGADQAGRDALGDSVSSAVVPSEAEGKGKGKGKPGDPSEPPGDLGPEIPKDADVLLAGASVVSIFPDPDAEKGERWERDYDKCATLSEATLTAMAGGDFAITDHLASTGSPWPENPDCIYMGGNGIGPMNPIVDIDDAAGLYVRTFAGIDDEGHAAVLTIVDGEGWFWEYQTKCAECGSKQIAATMGEELDIDPAGIVIAATHSHTAPDFIGGWGFVPDWYMTQVTKAIKQSIREAVTGAVPAVIEIGEERAREFNRERRDTYRSAEEQQISWFRALEVVDGRFALDDADNIATIAKIGAYAAHPTTVEETDAIGHADWPGFFANQAEQRFGGTGMHFMTGLGNMSASGGTAIGTHLANVLPEVLEGTILTDTNIESAQTTWNHPATNVPLTALAVPGFFDHPIMGGPAEVRTGPAPDTAPCVSASPVSAEVPASAILIGPDLAITAAPGEVFSNFTNTVKEKSGARVTLPLGQANDALGYMPQSFEINPVGQQGLGFFAGGYLIVNYEDSYAIDRCFGDMALETTITLLGTARGELTQPES